MQLKQRLISQWTWLNDYKQQRSRHRHISFTAHYTSYYWYKQGWSHPAFTTLQGQWLMHALSPIEKISAHLFNGNIGMTLFTRHQLIDQRLHQLIQQYPNLQIIELASGLSPRGWSFRNQYPALNYVEVDLPDMAVLKQKALTEAGQPSAKVISVDLMTNDIVHLFDHVDPQHPVVVVSEGFINYFTKPQLRTLWTRLIQASAALPHLFYISDVYPELSPTTVSPVFRHGVKGLRLLSRSNVGFHFHTPLEATEFLKGCGFQQVEIIEPSQTQTAPNKQQPSTIHHGDLVWMIVAARH